MSFIEGTVLIVFIIALMLVIMVFMSTHRTYQGKIVVDTDEEGNIIYGLEMNGDPYEIQNMKNVLFKVVKKEATAD